MTAPRDPPRILFAPLIPPSSAGDGGNLRSLWLLEALRSVGPVDVVLFHPLQGPVATIDLPPGVGRIDWTLAGAQARSGALGSVRRVLRHRRRDYFRAPREISQADGRWDPSVYDLVVCRYAKSGAYLAAAGVHPARCILDLDDNDLGWLDRRIEQSNGAPWQQWLYRRARRQVASFFPDLLRACRRLWVTNRADLSLRELCPATLLPNLPGTLTDGITPPQGKTILCVSSWGHVGNREGLREFLRVGWPRLRKADTKATLRICGSGYPRRLPPEFSQDGVTVVGQVPDLRPEYEACALAIAPVAFGAGTSIKVIEAIANGRICIATTAAARAQDPAFAQAGALVVGGTPADLAEHCAEVLSNLDTLNLGALPAFRRCRDEHSETRFRAIVRTTIEEVVGA